MASAGRACLAWLGSPTSEKYLFAVTFLESIFLPLIPDVLLAPMCACRPRRAMYLAALTTLASTLGGVVGYAPGFWVFDWLLEWNDSAAWLESYEQAKSLFQEWGGWIIVVAGFSPIPYKVFTVTAGAFAQPLTVFVMASLLGRGLRFFLVAWLAGRWGMVVLTRARPWIERFAWVLLVVLLVLLVAYWLKF